MESSTMTHVPKEMKARRGCLAALIRDQQRIRGNRLPRRSPSTSDLYLRQEGRPLPPRDRINRSGLDQWQRDVRRLITRPLETSQRRLSGRSDSAGFSYERLSCPEGFSAKVGSFGVRRTIASSPPRTENSRQADSPRARLRIGRTDLQSHRANARLSPPWRGADDPIRYSS